MLESPPTGSSRAAEPHDLEVAYELWLGNWEIALSAVATATETRTLTTREAAAHKAVIATERESVTRQFALLLAPRRADAA